MYQHVVKISDYTMGNYNNILKVLNGLIFLAVINGQSIEQSIGPRINKDNYELVYAAKTWLDAKEACESRGLQLAVPESQEEFLALQSYVRSMKYSKVKNSDYHLIAWIGVSRLVKDHEWRTVSGKKLSDNGFSKFSSHVADLWKRPARPQSTESTRARDGMFNIFHTNQAWGWPLPLTYTYTHTTTQMTSWSAVAGADPAEPQCAGVDAKNIGFRDWWCNQRLPYICQRF